MKLDVSYLKGINLSNPDTLAFVAIIVVAVLAVILSVISILFLFLKGVIKFIHKVFGVDGKRPEFNQGQDVVWIKEISKSEEAREAPKKILSSNMDFGAGMNAKKDKPEQKGDSVKLEKEKETKEILEGLNKFKNGADEGKGLQVKMPSRSEDAENGKREIKIPKAERFISNQQGNVSNIPKDVVKETNISHGQPQAPATVHNTPANTGAHVDTLIPKGMHPGQISQNQQGAPINSSQKPGLEPSKELHGEASPIHEKSSFLKSLFGLGKSAAKKDESIMFGSKDEISRIDLKTKLRKDPRVWQAQKELLMNLSPLERANLEKETFARFYGQDISKADLKANLNKMGREWATTSDSKRKEVLRKQIKFFKKIGGIK